MMASERLRGAPDATAHHWKYQHEVPSHRASNAAHRAVPHDDLPPGARGRVPKATTAEQELGRLARHRHHSVGGIATGQSTEGICGRATALRWFGLRLNHPIPRNFSRDRPSPRLGGHRQGFSESGKGKNAAFLKRLRQLRRRNPGSHQIMYLTTPGGTPQGERYRVGR